MQMQQETVSGYLPVPLNCFIGREREIKQIKELLTTAHLLTLTGPGGCGKTRLALQTATDLRDAFADGVCWVELAALGESFLIPQTIAMALDIPGQAKDSLIETIANALRSRDLLLVLDNCEHLITACAQVVESLLQHCSTLRILATSREALTISAETVFPVPSLRFPDTFHLPPVDSMVNYEAVRLFIERARSVQPSFTLTQETVGAVAHICRRLDGIPLAIELAAVRVKMLSLEQIVTRLEASYQLLSRGSRTALPRQQTLRATMDWSYSLLSEQEQRVFWRLSVFSGGFPLGAAEAVCADEDIRADEIFDVLSHLVDKSLVLVQMGNREVRYRLLETLRQYALDKLREEGEEEPVRQRHRDWFLALAEEAAPALLGKQQVRWYNVLEREHDNLRTALRWSIDRNDDQPSARLGAALWRFWLLRGHLNEGRHWLEQALAQVPERTVLRAEVLHAVGALASRQDDYARAYTLLEESIEICRTFKDTQGIAYALVSLSLLAHKQGDYVRATTYSEEYLPLLQQLGDKRATALTLSNLGMTVFYQGDDRRASALCEESLTLYRELGESRGIASSLTNLAMLLLPRGDYERASTLCQESLLLRQELGDKGGRAHTLTLLGRVALSQGDDERAVALYQESLSLQQELGDRGGIAAALERLAEVAGERGFLSEAVRLHGAVEAVRDKLGISLSPVDRMFSARSIDAIRCQLPQPAFTDQWHTG